MSNYEHEVEVPTEDGKGTEKVTLSLKPILELPVGILRRTRNNWEAQIFATFEWGLSEEQLAVFDRMPVPLMHEVLTAWQASPAEGKNGSTSEAKD